VGEPGREETKPRGRKNRQEKERGNGEIVQLPKDQRQKRETKKKRDKKNAADQDQKKKKKLFFGGKPKPQTNGRGNEDGGLAPREYRRKNGNLGTKGKPMSNLRGEE